MHQRTLGTLFWAQLLSLEGFGWRESMRLDLSWLKTPVLCIWQNKEHFKYEDRVNDERNDGWSVLLFFFTKKQNGFTGLLSIVISFTK